MNIVLTSQFKLYSGLLMISQSIFVFSAPYLDTLNYAINDFSDRFLVNFSVIKIIQHMIDINPSHPARMR